MASPGDLIFVTGGSGYLGGHIILHLLDAGYRVRAAARNSKIQDLKDAHSKYGDRFEVVDVPDIAHDRFPEALEGVSAVIHTAAPLPMRNSAEVMYREVREGTLNVVRQAEKAGIKRIIVTSSRASVGSGGLKMYSDQDWNPVTREQAGSSPLMAYAFSKTQAERDLWTFADEHPHVDITTINPPWLYGPFAKTFRLAEASPAALSSMFSIYLLLFPEGGYPRDSHYADVRDVASAHVKALTAPPTSQVGRKRLVLASPYDLDFAAARKLVEEKRPELASRWTRVEVPQFETLRMPYRLERLEEVLKMGKADFTPVENTILESVDSLVAIEKEWVDQLGYEVKIPVLGL